jgi:lambda family phage portal protein
VPDRRTLAQRITAAVSAWRQPPAAAGTSTATSAGAAVAARGRRMYASARSSRTTGGFGTGETSADAEISSSLARLRQRSRQMVRDSSYAKRAKKIVVGNVIGAGVGMQCQIGTTRGGLNDTVNGDIEEVFSRWCPADCSHTGGKLHFHDLERALLGEVFEAGEVLVRVHLRKFGQSAVPLGLELIESERLALDITADSIPAKGGDFRLGVECDTFGRPVAYWIRERHPGDIHAGAGNNAARYERVPADQIFHLNVVDRWPQTRGVPWLHTVLRKLDELNEYTALEVSAARGSAAYFATITTPDEDGPLQTAVEDDGKPVMELEPLTIQELAPGEELQFHAPNRPNSALDPFMRAMLREVASGADCSYESLSRDYSQSNYSSSRLSLIDDRETWRTLQQWWIRSFRLPLHRLWLRQAVLSRAVTSVSVEQYALNAAKFEAVHFKPRGWSWVDPTKEVNAYKEAIKAGMTTLTDVIAQTGGGQDIEDVVRTRRRELDLLDANEINVDTTVPEAPEAPEAPEGAALPEPAAAAELDDVEDTPPKRVIALAPRGQLQ